MTNLEAIYAEIKPYSADELDIEKALMGACKRTGSQLEITGNYAADNERTVALAAVLVLYKYMTLSAEKEGEWGQNYHDNIEKRIKALCNANGLDASEFVSPDAIITISDGSKLF
jgi:hypothetical protein